MNVKRTCLIAILRAGGLKRAREALGKGRATHVEIERRLTPIGSRRTAIWVREAVCYNDYPVSFETIYENVIVS